jgi:hypothetical protein
MSDVGSSGTGRTMTVFFSDNIFETSSGRDSSSTVRDSRAKDTSVLRKGPEPSYGLTLPRRIGTA